MVRPDTVLAHHLDENALAEAAVGDPQPRTGKGAADRFENGTAGEHEVGTLRADAGIGDTLLVGHGEQAVDYHRHLTVVEPAAVDPAPVVAGQIETDAGNGGHRPRGAEHVGAVDG